MKKILSLLLIGGFAALIACGPSAEEKAAAEKMRQDSINAAMAQITADSLAQVNAAMMEKARQDSMAMVAHADSVAQAEAAKKPASKPKAKTAVEKKVEEAKKVSSGRGH
jgi:hypothetical protein